MDPIHGIPLGTGIAVLGAAFGAWAWVVAWGVAVIRKEIAEIKSEVANARNEQHRSMLDMEHRLTAVESDIRRCVVFSRNGGE